MDRVEEQIARLPNDAIWLITGNETTYDDVWQVTVTHVDYGRHYGSSNHLWKAIEEAANKALGD